MDNKGCVDAMKVCTTVLVDTLITLKMTKGHAHNMKIATMRSFNNVKKTQRFRTCMAFFYDNDTQRARMHSEDAFCTHCIT